MDAPAKIVLAALLAGGTLCWEDPNPPGVVQSFNVYWRGEAAQGKWTRVATVTSNSAPVEFYLQYVDHGFFTVTASNAMGEVPVLPVGGSEVLTTNPERPVRAPSHQEDGRLVAPRMR